MPPRNVSEIASYHAHIYFDAGTEEAAACLREAIGECLDAKVGRWHAVPVGPHPVGMYQVAFSAAAFATVVPWLMLNRDGLSILVHPNTGDEVADHADNPLWLGEPLELNIDYLRALEASES